MLQDIVHAVQKVNTTVAEIASATREQSAGISEVNSAISKIDEMTSKNAALVEHDAAAAQVLLTRANDLSAAMGKYRISEAVDPVQPGALLERKALGGRLVAKAGRMR